MEGLIWGSMVMACIVSFLLVVAMVIAGWRQFTKAGQPGWASLIPFYRDYISYKIYWGEGKLFLVPVVLLALTPLPLIGVLAGLAAFALYAVLQYKKSQAFGHGIVFTVGLCLLAVVFEVILAFGPDQYLGIPQDGFSYEQLKSKYNLGEKKVSYTKPTEDKGEKSNISYTAPSDSTNKDK